MTDEAKRKPLTLDEFEAALEVNDGRVHTFVGGPGILLGADWPLKEAVKHARKFGAELAGDNAMAMRHGVVVVSGRRQTFFATNEAFHKEQS